MLLYCTADRIGQANHGAGAVTHNESEALKTLGPCEVWGREQLQPSGNHVGGGLPPHMYEEPWGWGQIAYEKVATIGHERDFALTHCYAGTFSYLVQRMKERGGKVTYTAAAHSIEDSKREHEELGIPYNLDHLVKPELWERYVAGYLAADRLIVPSTHSRDVMLSFGADADRIRVIPHGCEVPEVVHPLPRSFIVGYVGGCGADKGLRYLFAAWSKLNYPDAVLKIAGNDSTTDWTRALWGKFGGRGNVQFCGWQTDLDAFYGSLSLYVQPSASEGFGCEITESMAAARPVIASTGAGGSDCIPLGPNGEQFKVGPRDVDGLAEVIDYCKKHPDLMKAVGATNREEAKKYTWDLIRLRYVDMWSELLI